MKERTIINITLGVLIILLVGLSTLLVTALSGQLFPINKEQAVIIAQSKVQGQVTEIEEPTEKNPIYEVEVKHEDKESEVKVDANSGDIISIEEEEEDDEDEEENVPITGSALERASAAALAYVGEGRVTDTEIGDEEGYYEIEIRLDNGREVDVHLDEDFNVLSVED